MATETTFFSYSRADSAFVLKLAKDLRAAGARLWLDQLDIKAGSHWDTSIENALSAAGCVIVILSTTSVASNNVMDEVSFALESGKTIIPVLLNDCTTPFRLKRVQRIDFTGDYKTGFNQLMQALNLSADSNDMGSIKETEPITLQIPEKEITPPLTRQHEPKQDKPVMTFDNKSSPVENVNLQNNNKKYLLIAAGIIIIGFVIAGILKLNNSSKATDDTKPDTSYSASAPNDSGKAIVQNKADSSEPDSDPPAASVDNYPLRVRGCIPNTVLKYSYVNGTLIIDFTFGNEAAANLDPGQGSWLDRAMTAGEPAELHQKMPKEKAEEIIQYLQNPESYWTFYCYNTNKGFMNVIKSEKFDASK